MANCEMDPANLKSFQKISLEDARYLQALGKATAFARQSAAGRMQARGGINLRRCKDFFLSLFGRTMDKMLYETVPASEVYTARE